MTNEELEQKMDVWFMTVVNVWRNANKYDDELQQSMVRMTMHRTGLPEWLVLRFGSDMHMLTPEREARFKELTSG